MRNTLKAIRKEKRMSQMEFCELVGVKSQSHYVRIEQGADIAVSTALKIANSLGRYVEDIWKGED